MKDLIIWKAGGITKRGVYFNHQKYYLTWFPFSIKTKWFEL